MRNRDKRDDFIKAHGREDFDRIAKLDPKWAKLSDIDCPAGCQWIWEQFISIWNESERDINGNVILTYRTVLDYMECMNVNLDINERAMIFRMKHWAISAISELEDKEK